MPPRPLGSLPPAQSPVASVSPPTKGGQKRPPPDRFESSIHQRLAHPSSPARCPKEEQGVSALHGCTQQHRAGRATWVLPDVGWVIGQSSCHGSDWRGHLWKPERAAPAAGGVRRGPGHESLPSNEAESQGGVPGTSPTSRSYKGPFEKSSAPPPSPQAVSGLSCGHRHFWAAPRSLAWAWVSATSVKSHHPGASPERGFLAA